MLTYPTRARQFLNAAGAGIVILVSLLPLRAQFSEYPLFDLQAKNPRGITTGPDGLMWFTGTLPSAVASIAAGPAGWKDVFAYPLPNPASIPTAITAGPDGALWFIEAGSNNIGRMTTSGAVTEFPIPTAGSQPGGITAGPDGALWFTETGANKISRITTSGSITEYPLPATSSTPVNIVAGPDGALWFTEYGKIGTMSTSGAITEFPANNGYGIAPGPDGALWFTEDSNIGRITTSGVITEYPVPTKRSSDLSSITAGPDGALWFVDSFYSNLGRMDTSGTFSYWVSLPPGRGPDVMTLGSDGALWFTESLANAIGRFLPGPPPAVVTSLNPVSATAGSPGFTLTVNGTGFTTASRVEWDSAAIPTMYVSPTQLTATVDAGFIQFAGTAGISVVNAGIISNVVTFTINPGPQISSLSPSYVIVGAPSFTLTVNGSGFAPGAVVNWNGSPLPTTYVSNTQLTASVSSSLFAATGGAQITVAVGALASAASTFTIDPPPVIQSLFPPSATAGAPGFTLTIYVSIFDSSTVVTWNGSPLPAPQFGFGQITVPVSANLIGTPGMANVSVITGGVASNAAIFAIAPLTIKSLNPASVPAAGPAFALTLNGTGFTPGTTVNWNGSKLATGFLSTTEITASVPAALIASAGTATITAVSGFGPSADVEFHVTAPLASPCANVAGVWNWSESGSYTITVSAPVETDTLTNSLKGSGNVLITQTGCSISYNPVGTDLIASVLTPDQLAAFTRSGAVNGSTISISGLLAMIEAASPSGFSVTGVSNNSLISTGQVAANTITLNSTGAFSASGIYILNGQSGMFTLTITATSTAALSRVTGPAISSVAVANGVTGVAENTWIVIKGQDLVPSTTPAAGVTWSDAPEFAQGRMPTQLGGISVTVNGKPAFVYFYCSAATSAVCTTDQINALTPLDSTAGPVSVVVTNAGTPAPAFTATMESIAPSFLQFGAGGYAAATHVDGSLLGPATLYPGASTPAHPGETIVVYGVGFGLPKGPLVNGSSSQTGSLQSVPVCQMGGSAAHVSFAGLASPGLYQFNLAVPATAPSGDNALNCTYQGFSAASPVLISVQQ